MDIASLLSSLIAQGLSLSLGSGGSLTVLGPVAKLTPEQQQALAQHKQTLLSMLAPPPTCYMPSSGDAGDSADSLQPLREAIEFFELLIDDIGTHSPERLAQVVLEPGLTQSPCRRCGLSRSYLAIIHDGRSLRRDCARCGRFIDFPCWNEPELALEILTATAGGSRYNRKASCPSAGNTQASSCDSQSSAKETANG